MGLWDENEATWTRALAAYDTVIGRVSNDKATRKKGEVSRLETLLGLEEYVNVELPRAVKEAGFMEKTQLQRLMKWKLARGQFRPLLPGLIDKNSEAAVREATQGIAELEPGKVLGSGLAAVTELKGVGPTTASAILSLWHPHSVAFFSDEAMLEVPQLHGKKEYTAKALKVFTKALLDKGVVLRKRSSVGRGAPDWTPCDVERALFAWHHDSQLKDASGDRKRVRRS